MNKCRSIVWALVFWWGLANGMAAQEVAGEGAANPQVTIDTTLGRIVVELFPDKAPKTVENFLAYANMGFYDGTTFHRVIPGFMVQGGGLTPDLERKPTTRPPVINEATNGLGNERGTIAMARVSNPHSATSQFFINVIDNSALNHRDKTARGWGYAVFGKVVQGMQVVDAISEVPTMSRAGRRNIPIKPVIIKKVWVQ